MGVQAAAWIGTAIAGVGAVDSSMKASKAKKSASKDKDTSAAAAALTKRQQMSVAGSSLANNGTSGLGSTMSSTLG